MSKPGNFYVSVKREEDEQYRLLAGPFASHRAALDYEPRARRIAIDLDPKGPWYLYGTCQVHGGFSKPGILNGQLGL